MLRPGSKVPAPTMFGMADIKASEEKAMAETKLQLQQHDDRKGAAICGKQHALDRAILDSIGQTTRAGGIATRGTREDLHLIAVTGDGAGISGEAPA